MAVFARLAAAEAKVHGMPSTKCNFHEVGAVDAIIDIVGSVAGIAALAIERLYASPLPMGGGWVKSAHGQLPLPPPPRSNCSPPPPRPPAPPRPRRAGHAHRRRPARRVGDLRPAAHAPGAPRHRRRFARSPWPNVARLWLAEPQAAGPHVQLVQLEANIDDMNPQLYAPVMDRLFAAGALDVWLTPVQMKKSRPGIVLAVLSAPEHEAALAQLLLRETTTLGVRVSSAHRHEAQREMASVQTPFGPVPVKLKRLEGRLIAAAPEFDDCRRLAEERGVPVREVYDAAAAAARAAFAVG